LATLTGSREVPSYHQHCTKSFMGVLTPSFFFPPCTGDVVLTVIDHTHKAQPHPGQAIIISSAPSSPNP